jgi:hypothetical protein
VSTTTVTPAAFAARAMSSTSTPWYPIVNAIFGVIAPPQLRGIVQVVDSKGKRDGLGGRPSRTASSVLFAAME